MIVKRIELDYFRNYVHMEAAFDPRVNLIYGENAQGKTNLLEALAYLSTARSHRARFDKEMILIGVDEAFVKGLFELETAAEMQAEERRSCRTGVDV